MMTNLMTILERKAFISSNPRIVLSSCPPPCGHFSIQESATGGLSYKVKKAPLPYGRRASIIGAYLTFTVTFTDLLPDFTVIFAVPFFFPVTTPLEETVATFLLELV